jgi:hypothetical protein
VDRGSWHQVLVTTVKQIGNTTSVGPLPSSRYRGTERGVVQAEPAGTRKDMSNEAGCEKVTAKSGKESEAVIPFMKGYTVFNAEQIDRRNG